MHPKEARALLKDQPQDQVFDVSRRLFTDDEVFELEMQHIFEGSWIYLCHESQAAKPNDFFTTHMGRQPVVIIRGEDGELRCFINACAHRGATLCRTSRGNNKFLTCSYHGWTYNTAGKNVDIKDLDSGGYPDAFMRQSHDLTQIARLETYAGFVFGSLNPDVPELGDYLAATKPFIDMLDEMGADGCEVLPGASTYLYKGNWKMQAENGIDGYHFTTIHANYVGMVSRRLQMEAEGVSEDKVKMAFDDSMMDTMLQAMHSGCYDLHNGHGIIWIDFPKPENRPLWSESEAVIKRVGQAKADWMLKRQRNLFLYPNVQLMEQASSQIRVFRPLTPNATEVKSYCIAPKGESKASRERRIRQFEDFFNATGMATPDDLTVFEECQRGFRGHQVEWQQGYDRGYKDMIIGADESAEALGIEPYSSGLDATHETLYHGQYRVWQELIAAGLKRTAGG